MAEITLSAADGPYKCSIDTSVMNVEIRESYLGVLFITESGEQLNVCMRDSGFELVYRAGDRPEVVVSGIDLKNGLVHERSMV